LRGESIEGGMRESTATRRVDPDIVRARVDRSPGSVGISRGARGINLHATTDVGSRSVNVLLTSGQARRLARRLIEFADSAS